jgi:hypothetical protein
MARLVASATVIALIFGVPVVLLGVLIAVVTGVVTGAAGQGVLTAVLFGVGLLVLGGVMTLGLTANTRARRRAARQVGRSQR